MSPGSGSAYPYEAVATACRRGRYPSMVIRAASGRVNFLMGVTPRRLALLRRKAQEANVGLVLIGSRVSGPRLRQRTLHPVLAATLPLKTARRSPSAVFGGVDGIEIDKTVIKDYGPENAHTSDISIILVDAHRTPEQMRELARRLEVFFQAQGWGFPLRFFADLSGTYLRSEEDFLVDGENYLRGLLPPGQEFSDEQLRRAMEELYFAVNLPRSAMRGSDLRNAVIGAALLTAASSARGGFEPALMAVGFFLGLMGRYIIGACQRVAFILASR